MHHISFRFICPGHIFSLLDAHSGPSVLQTLTIWISVSKQKISLPIRQLCNLHLDLCNFSDSASYRSGNILAFKTFSNSWSCILILFSNHQTPDADPVPLTNYSHVTQLIFHCDSIKLIPISILFFTNPLCKTCTFWTLFILPWSALLQAGKWSDCNCSL